MYIAGLAFYGFVILRLNRAAFDRESHTTQVHTPSEIATVVV